MGRYIADIDNVNLPASGVTAGTYTNATITVSSQGIVTAASSGSTPITVLNDLSDVDITGLSPDEILQFNGSDWVNSTLDLDNISDVTLVSPVNGDILVYDGTDWMNSSLSAEGILTTADIGINVQAWDADLDAIAALATDGYIVKTGSGTYETRSIVPGTNSGLSITNEDGISGDTTIVVDFTTFNSVTSIEEDVDLLAFYNDDVGQMEVDTIENIVLSATPVIGGDNIGTGAEVFKQLNTTTKLFEFREITSGNAGIVITEDATNISIAVSDNLFTLTTLTPTDNYFIVGDGSDWTTEDPATARTSLGLGTAALNDDTDYIRVDGTNEMAANLDMGASVTNRIVNLDDPVDPQDAATKAYVDVTVISSNDAGDGLTRTGTVLDVGAGTGIIVDATNVNLDTTYTDTLYYQKTILNDDSPSAPGGSLIGTEDKENLGNATTVEDALEYLNNNWPVATSSVRMELTLTWNLDVGAPNVVVDTFNDVEVARFVSGDDVAIYRDLMLPPDYDNTRDLTLYGSFKKETSTSGTAVLALATQHQRLPFTSFTADDTITFSFADDEVHVVSWTIPGSLFEPLDTVTLRLSRLGTSGSDDHVTGMDFLASYLIQE